MRRWISSRRVQLGNWLSQGISPRRLALTLALGFALGCLPILGISTVVCLVLAVLLGLNQPAIQAANYAALPAQLLLIGPFLKLGRWLLSSQPVPANLMHAPLTRILSTSGSLAGQAVLAWLLVAAPAVMLLTLGLTPVLRRVPAIAASGN